MEILTNLQKKIFNLVSNLPDKEAFYLTGGTALYAGKFPELKIDTLIDIATNKLLALFGRAELRDFIDIYFLTKEHFSKDELVKKTSRKDPWL